MSEIIFKLFFFVMLVIFFSFGFLVREKLIYWENFHGLDFISIDKDFKISTGSLEIRKRNIVYISRFPDECKDINRNSIKCLSAIKKQGGTYNGLLFFSGTNIYK